MGGGNNTGTSGHPFFWGFFDYILTSTKMHSKKETNLQLPRPRINATIAPPSGVSAFASCTSACALSALFLWVSQKLFCPLGRFCLALHIVITNQPRQTRSQPRSLWATPPPPLPRGNGGLRLGSAQDELALMAWLAERTIDFDGGNN